MKFNGKNIFKGDDILIEDDTIKLLRECNSGIKMGTDSIEEMIPKIQSNTMREILYSSKKEHEDLGNMTKDLLHLYHDQGKKPSPMVQNMAHMKTNILMTMDCSDNRASDILTDGCNMGVKSLSRYLNQYKASDEKSKDIAKKLISMEDRLALELREYL